MNSTPICLTMMIMVALMSSACEQTIDVDLPYQKRLVFDGFVLADTGTSQTMLIRLSKTIPVLADPDSTSTRPINARMWMETESGSVDLVQREGGSLFEMPVGFRQLFGQTVTIKGTGDGMAAEARTRIPNMPTVLSTRFIDSITPWGSTITSAEVRVVVDGGTVVWLESWGFRSSSVTPMAMYEAVYVSAKPAGQRDTMNVRGGTTVRYGSEEAEITIYSADGVYLRYLQSPFGDGSDPFGFGGVNPFFNVMGDGIGLAIGVSAVTATARR